MNGAPLTKAEFDVTIRDLRNRLGQDLRELMNQLDRIESKQIDIERQIKGLANR